MRILNILTGFIFVIGGFFLIAEEGISFMSVAFVVGLAFMIAGLFECLSYRSYRGNDTETKTWILVDGATTFVLGALILTNQIVSDAVVTMVLGFWAITTGIRNIVRIVERKKYKGSDFTSHLIIGLINLIAGTYVFYDSEVFNLPSIVLVAICVIVDGVNIINVGFTIVISKPKIIKTKTELLAEAQLKMEESHEKARVAIEDAKKARTAFTVIYDTPAEVIDATIAPMPQNEGVVERRKQIKEKRMTAKEKEAIARREAIAAQTKADKERADKIAQDLDAAELAKRLLWEKRSEAAKKGAETKRKMQEAIANGTYKEKVRTPEEQALWEKRSEAAKKGAETKRKIHEAMQNGTYEEKVRTPEEQALWEKRSEAAKKGAETKRKMQEAIANGTYRVKIRTPEEQALWEKRSEAAKKGAETKRRNAENN